MSISIRNRLPGTIEKIVSDKVVSEVVIRTAAGIVTSIITTGSVKRMNLREGDNVFAVTKATAVSGEKEKPAGLMPDVLRCRGGNGVLGDIRRVITDAFKT